MTEARYPETSEQVAAIKELAKVARRYREEVFEMWSSEFGTGRNEGPQSQALRFALKEIDVLEKQALGDAG